MRANAQMQLGRLPSVVDSRNLRFNQFFKPAYVSFPDILYGFRQIERWGVMGNNNFGNCVIVGKAHMIGNWYTQETKIQRMPTDEDVIKESRALGALNGFSILESMKIWRNRGILGDKIWAFVGVNLQNKDEVKACLTIFGAIAIGVNLPRAWQNADTWDVGIGRNYTPNSWGPHDVPIVGYDSTYVYVVSWGEIIPMTWEALFYYCDEAFTGIDCKWFGSDFISPTGYDLPKLKEALDALQ